MSKRKTWFRSRLHKGWKYCETRYGTKTISAKGKTYVIVDICDEVKTTPETQAGYLWKLRAVYSYGILTVDLAMKVLEAVHGEAIRKCVCEWTEHLCLIEECGEYIGQTKSESNSVLNDVYLERK